MEVQQVLEVQEGLEVLEGLEVPKVPKVQQVLEILEGLEVQGSEPVGVQGSGLRVQVSDLHRVKWWNQQVLVRSPDPDLHQIDSYRL